VHVYQNNYVQNRGKSCAKLTIRPEIILNNFNTRIGIRVGRLLAALFPHDPQYKGRHVITFHNQRDFIFFRHHMYLFKDQKKSCFTRIRSTIYT